MKSAKGRSALATLGVMAAGGAVLAGSALAVTARSAVRSAVKESVVQLPGAIKDQPVQIAAGPGKSTSEWTVLSPVVSYNSGTGTQQVKGTYALISAPSRSGSAKTLSSGKSLTDPEDLSGVAWPVHDGARDLLYEGAIYRLSSSGKPTIVNHGVDGGVGLLIGPDGDLYTTDDGMTTEKCAVQRSPVKCTAIAWPSSLDPYIGPGGPDALASAGGRLWEVTQAADLFSMTTAGKYAGPFDTGRIDSDPGNEIVGSGSYLYAAATSSKGAPQIDRISAKDPKAAPKAYGSAAGLPKNALFYGLTMAGGNVWFIDSRDGKVGELTVGSGKIKEYSLPRGYELGNGKYQNYSEVAAGPSGTVFASVYNKATGKPALVRFSG